MKPNKIYLSKLVMAGAEILDKPVSDDDVEYIRADVAVEGEVVKDINSKLAVTAKNVNLDGFKFGDKVRIIIVKEDL